MTERTKGTMEVRLTDENGRRLTVLATSRKPVSATIDGIVLDQAEGRITILEMELHPGQAFGPRGSNG